MNNQVEHNQMKTFTILVFVLAMALTAFAQADSCNMSLVDEWVGTYEYDWTGIDLVGDFVLVALSSHVIVLEIDASGNLTYIDSVGIPARNVAHKDSFCFFVEAGGGSSTIHVYSISI